MIQFLLSYITDLEIGFWFYLCVDLWIRERACSCKNCSLSKTDSYLKLKLYRRWGIIGRSEDAHGILHFSLLFLLTLNGGQLSLSFNFLWTSIRFCASCNLRLISLAFWEATLDGDVFTENKVTLGLIKDCGELIARGLSSWDPVMVWVLNSGGKRGCL